MPVLTMNFEAGTTGEVEFVCRYFRFEVVGGSEISAPFNQIEPITADQVVVTLPSGVDPDVIPNPWAYKVLIRVDGQKEFVCFLTMPMTAANFVDYVVLEEPGAPELYVTKAEFLDHVDTGGGGGGVTSHSDLDDLDVPSDHPWAALSTDLSAETARATGAEADLASDLSAEVTARAADVDAEEAARIAADAAEVTARDAAILVETNARIADVNAEETRALAAEAALDGRLDTEEALSITFDSRLDTAETDIDALDTDLTAAEAAIVAEVANRITDVNAEEARALAAEILLAPLAGPAFTGNPTAPNQTAGNDSTRLANTHFVTDAVATASGLLIPKSLGTTKGDIITFTASGAPTRRGVGANGTFLVANSANADGWETRALAYTDTAPFPKSTMSVGVTAIGSGSTVVMGLTAATNPGVTVSQTHAFHSDSSNRSRMTIPSGLDGDYLCLFAFNLGGTENTGARRARLLKNGSTLATLTSPDAPTNIPPLETTAYMAVGLVAGDYLEVDCFQDGTGGALNFTMSVFTIIRIP